MSRSLGSHLKLFTSHHCIQSNPVMVKTVYTQLSKQNGMGILVFKQSHCYNMTVLHCYVTETQKHKNLSYKRHFLQ